MRQFERNFLIGVTAYALAAIVTFGHAAANHVYTCNPIPRWEICNGDRETGQKAMVGIMAGFVWPLYWSWEAFSHDA